MNKTTISMAEYINKMRLRDVLDFGGVPKEQVEEIDSKLQTIKNE